MELFAIALKYSLLLTGASAVPAAVPKPTPRNARPPSPGEKCRVSWKTIGYAAKKAYRIA